MILILVILLILDSLYIGLQIPMFKKLYQNIQKSPLEVKPLGVIACYTLITFILYHYIISIKKSVKDSFILGVCVYGLYDATNYTLLTNYPLHIALMDILWGGILFALTTFIYYKIH